MREVAKSMLGFSWAVSLFGVQQLAKLVTPSSEPAEVTALQFDEASRAVQSYLSDSVAQQFRTVDAWQRRVVDAVFDAGAMTGLQNIDASRVMQTLDPRPYVAGIDARQAVQSSMDFARQSFDTLRQTVQPSRVN
jgi:hypothetical protein